MELTPCSKNFRFLASISSRIRGAVFRIFSSSELRATPPTWGRPSSPFMLQPPQSKMYTTASPGEKHWQRAHTIDFSIVVFPVPGAP